ncbi:hypothetical protein K6Y31_06715 [Motilimonas cestriensis]|uniref:Uncharacterized protein n=1 Tax=Motilimonas cestriensis TaxID=2742685 RepID=A0ABS8W688_9GAMM|nr:hypothetical protein [Motilimonas cestriensis]MCE2594502.1 hypothetical protein [Motilimonas cestriensis]
MVENAQQRQAEVAVRHVKGKVEKWADKLGWGLLILLIGLMALAVSAPDRAQSKLTLGMTQAQVLSVLNAQSHKTMLLTEYCDQLVQIKYPQRCGAFVAKQTHRLLIIPVALDASLLVGLSQTGLVVHSEIANN